MKNIIKLLGIIARTNKFVTILFVTALIGFSMIACDDGAAGPGGGGGGGGGGGNPTGLTVTGLPSTSGTWYAYVYPQGVTISTARDTDRLDSENQREAFAGVRGNTFPLHLGHLGQSSVSWTGSGNRQVVLRLSSRYYVATVNFFNGSATVPFSNFRDIPNS